MSSPWDEVRRESLEMPAVGARRPRPSPLPWMLLAVSITLTIVVLVLGKSRVESERARTATALKANDEVKAQLKAAQKKLEEQQEACNTQAESSAELSRQIVTLELEKRRLQEELAQAKGGKK
ncbi:MAG: hypothetical protein AB1938_10265 [Myxococcota bacterium]